MSVKLWGVAAATLGVVPAMVCALLPAAFPLFLALGCESDSDTAEINSEVDAGTVPEKYVAAVKKAASFCPEITAPLIAAQIETESGWNPKAVSGAGAQGIAQFMPFTWSSAGHDYSGDGKADIWDPNDAIPSQGKLMCENYRKVKADVAAGRLSTKNYSTLDLALAAYNAGYGGMSNHGGLFFDTTETTKYPGTIRELARKYAANSSSSEPTVTTATPKASKTGNASRASKSSFSGKFSPPVKGAMPVTSPFGWRPSPLTGLPELHTGVDLGIAAGVPQYATAPGVVVQSGWGDWCGISVRIQHPDYKGNKYLSMHCHLQRATVKVGQKVLTGDQIGETGTTGPSTGPHVHYQVEVNGKPVDPWPSIKDGKLVDTRDAAPGAGPDDSSESESLLPTEVCDLLGTGTSESDDEDDTNDNSSVLPEGERRKIVEYAKTLLDKKYRWGGTGPDYFDCSGFVQYVFKHAIGKNLPRTAVEQGKAGKPITRGQAQAGDIVVYGTEHVGIYIGGGKLIHAASPAEGILISDAGAIKAPSGSAQYVRIL